MIMAAPLVNFNSDYTGKDWVVDVMYALREQTQLAVIYTGGFSKDATEMYFKAQVEMWEQGEDNDLGVFLLGY